MSIVFTILVFALVLVVLIVVHELGHFVVAKMTGMRVDEFGIGYPPRIAGIRYGETEYTLNALPFGGFVRIYGEDDPELKSNPSESAIDHDPRAFASRPRIAQAATLVAGIIMNILLAYVLITITLFINPARPLEANEIAMAKNVHLSVAEVLPKSPAANAGIKPGDTLVSISGNGTPFSSLDTNQFSSYISSDADLAPLTFMLIRNGMPITVTAVPSKGIITADPARVGLGLAVGPVGMMPISLAKAPIEGATLTAEITKETVIGLASFFASFFTFHANLSQVSGPVGIASTVGNAAHQGIAALLSISAIISINLAVINLLPIPALDGGRLLFVIVESITRRPIKSSVAQRINMVGFALILLLMVVVTGHDLYRLFI